MNNRYHKCNCVPAGQIENMSNNDKSLLPSASCDLVNLMGLKKPEIVQFLENIDTVFTDCDGVLWKSGEPLPGSVQVINSLKKKGKKVFLITNNSTKSRKEVAEKVNKYGFNVNEEDIICTSYLVAQYLKDINFNKKVYIFGASGIEKELNNIGIKSMGAGPARQGLDLSAIEELEKDPNIGAVVVGFDVDICYEKITLACSYLANPAVLFIATNTDEVFPSNNPDIILPGSGVMVQTVSTCTGRKPDAIMGKPEEYMMKYIKEKYNPDVTRTLMIGDRTNTDIVFGKRCGFKTLLVLTGITTLEELEVLKDHSEPEKRCLLADYYIPKLGDLEPYINKI